MRVDAIIDGILAKEKGYVDHPNDNGGPTNYGITLAVARANGYMGAMQDLPEAVARAIYAGRYITGPGFDKLLKIDEDVACELIDTGVNMGPTIAGVMFQRWLNGFNMHGSKYHDLFVDGKIGPVTVDAYVKLIEWRGERARDVMLYALNCTQGSRYLDIVENNEKQEDFLWGWMLNRVVADLEAHIA